MDWYNLVAGIVILLQITFLVLVVANYRFALVKYARQRGEYSPRVALIVPCKDLDVEFDRNISALFNQDYDDFRLYFVVAEAADPAYTRLNDLRARLRSATKAKGANILVSGIARSCSQKIHNLLHAWRQLPADIDVIAFADSDASVRPDWLRHLVHPLRLDKTGVSTGYRWYVPRANNIATLVLSILNGKVAQLLGNTRFNQAWGGSMAIRTQTFRELGIDRIWERSLSDDLSLSCAVKNAGRKVEFVPACLVASHESTTWPRLFEFARRQFVITRIFAPQTWGFGLFTCTVSVLSLWVSIAAVVYAAFRHPEKMLFCLIVLAAVLVSKLLAAVLRQRMISKLLAAEWPRLKLSAAVDIALFWLWSSILIVFILASAFGRTITWRGIRYKLISRTQTLVLDSN